MKTTIELPDALLAQARSYAASRSITMKALIEQALRKILTEKRQSPKFSLRDASFDGGSGLTQEFQSASWEQIRDAIYERRAR